MLSWALGLALWLATAPTLLGAENERRRAPNINLGGVVNGASFPAAPDNFLVPNGIVSIFGEDLALRTRGVSEADLQGGRLPLSLGGVTVLIGGLAAPLYFVSPGQINAQVPSGLLPGETWLRIIRESLQSNLAAVQVRSVDPGLFAAVTDAGGLILLATHLDYNLVGRGELAHSTPAHAGEIVVLFGTGLGLTVPPVAAGQLPPFAAQTLMPVGVWLAGALLPNSAVGYAGQAPGLAGVYQINLTLPENTPPGDHEIVIEVDGLRSQPGLTLAVDP